MSSSQNPPAELSRPGTALQRVFPVVMVIVVVPLASWLVLGRAVVGALGSLTVVYAFALALPVVALHTVAAALFRRDALNYPSHAMSLRGVLTALASWVVIACFGFFLPDATAHGTESVLTALTSPDMLGISYGFANTFGVISLALSVALVLLALTDLRVTARRLRGEALTEDEILDRAEHLGS